MKKYLYKNLMLLIFILVYIFIFNLIVMMPINNDIKTHDNLIYPYESTGYDYKIYAPSHSQVEEIKQRDDVTSILPFYQIRFDDISKINQFDLFIIGEFNLLNFTEFSSERVIKKIDNTLPSLYIAINENTAIYGGYDLGETIVIKIGQYSFDFTVGAIYQNDDNFSDYMGFISYEDVDNALESVFDNNRYYLNYEGAYISVSNSNSFETFLYNEFKPWGLLWPRSYYSSDISYQAQYDFIISTDYEDYHIVKSDEFQSKQAEIEQVRNAIIDNTSIATFAHVIIMIVLIIFIIFSSHKKNKKMINEGVRSIDIFKELTLLFSLFILVTSIAIYVMIVNNKPFYEIQSLNNSYSMFLLFSVVVWIFSITMSLLYVSYVLNSRIKLTKFEQKHVIVNKEGIKKEIEAINENKF